MHTVILMRNAFGKMFRNLMPPNDFRHADGGCFSRFGRERIALFLLNVVVKNVDFPKSPVRIGDPKFGLAGMTAFHALLTLGRDAGGFQTYLHLDKSFGI